MRVTGTRHLVLAALVVAGALVISTCGENGSPTAPTAPSNIPILASTTQLPSVTLVGAGNIARCDRTANAQATAALLVFVKEGVRIVHVDVCRLARRCTITGPTHQQKEVDPGLG